MQIGSLFMALGFDVDDKKLDDFSGKVGGLKSGLVGLAGTAAAGVGALSAMTLSASNTAVSLSNINLLTGEATESMQRLASVAVGTNPLLGMQESLQSLAGIYETIVDAEWGEGATGSLAHLGMTRVAQKSIEDFVMEARRIFNTEMSGISQGKKIRMFEEANFPKELIPMLNAPQSRFDELYKREIIDEKEIQALNDFRFALETATYELNQLKNNLGALFAPIAKNIVEPVGNLLGDFNQHINKQTAELEANKNKEKAKALVSGEDVGYFQAWGKLLGDMVGYNPDRWIEERLKQGVPVPEKDLQRYMSQNNVNTTNNFNIETSADGREVAESLFDLLDEQQNRGIMGELPSTANGGVR